jgi:hypothetical protein
MALQNTPAATALSTSICPAFQRSNVAPARRGSGGGQAAQGRRGAQFDRHLRPVGTCDDAEEGLEDGAEGVAAHVRPGVEVPQPRRLVAVVAPAAGAGAKQAQGRRKAAVKFTV